MSRNQGGISKLQGDVLLCEMDAPKPGRRLYAYRQLHGTWMHLDAGATIARKDTEISVPSNHGSLARSEANGQSLSRGEGPGPCLPSPDAVL